MTETKKKVAAGKSFKRGKKVTNANLLKIEVGVPVFVKITDSFKSKIMKKRPATFASVTNLETGEVQQILVNAVLQRQIEENYPGEAYVGKSFEIVKGEKVKGAENDYYEFDLFEIEE